MDYSLTNVEIVQILAHYNIPLRKCCCKDELKDKKKGKLENGAYVINMGDSSTNGTHWVCLIVRDKEILYYDSFGEIYPTDVREFVGGKKIIIYNTDQIQDLKDTSCGFYCVGIIYFVAAHPKWSLQYSLNQYNSMFREDTKLNRNILRKYIDKLK